MGTGWQPLPEGLPPEVQHFVEQLRLLKDRTGLSLVALGQQTAYSKSSWQRYLNAQQPPPRQAVAALCRVAGVDCERFGVRWELAVRAWPRGGVERGGAEGAVASVSPAREGIGGRDRGSRDGEEPTVPWWEPVPSPAREAREAREGWKGWKGWEGREESRGHRAGPSWRFVACVALVGVAVLLVGVLWLLARSAG
ncbi:helix-turn-helix transcriptional regulator [Streptomyces sp. NPDC041068]|uniref:helix-turn-helix domain-containing protein n=1 Tax=Streptomyces sp. NPDC041068 TaxID=3155130 RepID=UPI0033FFD859